MMIKKPFITTFDLHTGFSPDSRKPVSVRKLSNMKNMFLDEKARARMEQGENTLVYEFFEMGMPELANELAFGTSICYPGKVGNEFFMTKGHFHEVFDCAETYICLSGKGIMLMETPDGEWDAPVLTPGKMVYVPGGWAHRSVNIGSEPFVTFFNFRGDAGHDYATIEEKGYRKLVVDNNGAVEIVDNPRWK